MRTTFTSESVTEGHPDKMADQISDAVLDALLAGDPMSLGHCTPLARRVPRGLHPVIAVVEQTDSFEPDALKTGSVFYNFRQIPGSEAHDELPGLSAFYKDADGTIFHTYSSYARGGEEMIGALMILDNAPKGRNETTTMDFVRRHDEYEAKSTHTCCNGAATV